MRISMRIEEHGDYFPRDPARHLVIV